MSTLAKVRLSERRKLLFIALILTTTTFIKPTLSLNNNTIDSQKYNQISNNTQLICKQEQANLVIESQQQPNCNLFNIIKQVNDSLPLASSIEPIYFGRYPVEPPTEQRDQFFNSNNRQQQQQRNNYQTQDSPSVSSFYSMGEQTGGASQQDEPLEEVLLKPFVSPSLELLPSKNGAPPPRPKKYTKQQQQQQQPVVYNKEVADLGLLNFGQFDFSGGSVGPILPGEPPDERRAHQQVNNYLIERGKMEALGRGVTFKRPKLSISLKQLPKLKPSPMQTKQKINLNAVYQPSILRRPNKPINLSFSIKPGEVLTSAKKETTSGGVSTTTNSISVNEIEDLLRRLKHLTTVNESSVLAGKGNEFARKTPATTLITTRGKTGELEDGDEVGDDSFIDEEDLEELRRQNRLSRVLPTSHLFGGSVGLVNENRINQDGKNDGSLDHLFSNRTNKAVALPSSDDMLFLKSLSDLGSKLSEDQKPSIDGDGDDDDRELLEMIGDKNEGEEQIGSNDLQRQVSRGATIRRGLNKQRRWQRSNEHQQPTSRSIPIEVLVDHLMSSSRLATFGIQHDGVSGPKSGADDNEPSETGETPFEEVEDDDDEDDDQDNNDTLPHESSLSETILSLPSEQSNLTFSSVLNRTNSWIPLERIELGDNKSGKNRRGKRRKRTKKVKKTRNKRDGLGLMIGDKVLTRTDLVRLIGILNKMASKGESSKERDASRKLLRFLVKLALDEYKRNRNITSSTGKTGEGISQNKEDSSVRNSLRSVVMGPIDGKGPSNRNNESSIDLHPLMLHTESGNHPDSEGGGSIGSTNNGKAEHEPDPEQQQMTVAGKRRGRVSLNEVSDDLEQYFDSDFFEDLADKMPNNTSSSTNSQRASPNRRRSSRLGYALPVPIYGHQQIEAADEDDVELDHVRVTSPPQRRHRSSGRRLRPATRMSSTTTRRNRERIGRRRASDGKRLGSSSRQPRAKSREESEEEPENGEEEEDEEKSVGKYVQQNEEREAKKKKPRRQPVGRAVSSQRHELKAGGDANDQVDEPDDQSEEADDTGEGEAATEPEQHKDGEAVQSKEDKGKTVEKEASKRRKKRRRKRRKRKRTPAKGVAENGSERKQKGPVEIDLDSRDEIPAPIVAGRSGDELRHNNKTKTTTTAKPVIKSSPDIGVQNGKSSSADNNKKTGGNKPVAVAVTKKSPDTKKINNKKVDKTTIKRDVGRGNRHDRSVKTQQRKKQRNRASPEQPDEPPNKGPSRGLEDDDDGADYYNEGTSYSEICDDDGKCQVSIQSSSPKLSKAIEARDKPAIVKHLDNSLPDPD